MKKHHMKDGMHHSEKAHHSSHGVYEHETDHPQIPPVKANEPMMNLHDFKGDAMDTAYGQAGKAGCAADEKKIHSQFKSYGWDANTGY